MSVELHGYKFSVYAWMAGFALREKRVGYAWREVDPFADDVPADYLAIHPFGRVPTLVHGDVVVYETSAITRYVDEAFEGPALQPVLPRDRARANQIISVIDSYGYWPLVRQVFSHGVMAERMDRASDQSEYQQGLAAAPRVLKALENLAEDGDFLVGDHLTLADIHLAPIIGYFTSDAEGLALFNQQHRLRDWWQAISVRPAFIETWPELPTPPK